MAGEMSKQMQAALKKAGLVIVDVKRNYTVYKMNWRALERNKYAPWGRQAY